MSTQQFEEKYYKYKDLLFRIIFTYVKNPNDAEDILQEVFTKLYCSNKAFETDEHEKRWLIRVTVNESKNMCTSFWHKRIVSLEESKSDAEFSFENDEESELYDAVMKLGEKYRIVVHLYYYEEYSVKEIAEI